MGKLVHHSKLCGTFYLEKSLCGGQAGQDKDIMALFSYLLRMASHRSVTYLSYLEKPKSIRANFYGKIWSAQFCRCSAVELCE